MNGGPSQLETFDPKPKASADVRGPYQAIATRIPGVHFSETLPRLAMLADRFALVRSLTWDGPAVHAAAIELLTTGVTGTFPPQPALTARVNDRWQPRGLAPHAVVLGDNLDSELEFIELSQVLSARRSTNIDRFGQGDFGRRCSLACNLIEAGTQFVTIHSHAQLHAELTWDCHADGMDLATTLNDYGNFICPEFDLGCSALLEHLDQRNLLEETLVVAVGEFGRTSHINSRGGRDHATGAWSALVAGGNIRPGVVVGASDSQGASVATSPVAPFELFRVIESHLGIPHVPAEKNSTKKQAPISALANLFV